VRTAYTMQANFKEQTMDTSSAIWRIVASAGHQTSKSCAPGNEGRNAPPSWTSNGASTSYNHLQHGRFLVSITLIVDIVSSPPLLRANQRPVTAMITAATSLSRSMLLLLVSVNCRQSWWW
jgi:hypothetical protein